jgi:hypothetical protein
MISMPPPVSSAIPADASLRVSSRPRARRMLVVLLALLAVLFGGAGSIASGQTALFSRGETIVDGAPFFASSCEPISVAVDHSGNAYVANCNGYDVEEILAVNGRIPSSPIIKPLTSIVNCNSSGIAVDGSGNVFVGCVNSNKAALPDGVYEILAVNGSIPDSPTVVAVGGGLIPDGLAADSSGNVYVVGWDPSLYGETNRNNVYEIVAVNGTIPASPTVRTLGSGFNFPVGLAVDASGNVYVADLVNDAVKEILAVNGSIPTTPTIVTLASGLGFPTLVGVAVDSSGNVYVADSFNKTVKEILAVNGSIPGSPAIITVLTGFKDLRYVAVGSNGIIYAVDPFLGLLIELSPSGGDFGTVNAGTTSPAIPMIFTFDTAGTLGSTAVLTQGATGLDFADAGSGTCVAGAAYTAGQTCTVNVTFKPRFSGTRYGAVVLNDTSGNVLATGYLQGMGVGPQINFLPNTESTVASASSGLDAPLVVAVDGSGNLYVADAVANLILKETPSAGGYTQTTVPTSGLNNPTGIAVDGSGSIYVADYLNLRVLKETPSASGGYKESVVASFSTDTGIVPIDVAVDSIGNVYIVDGGNGLVLKETLSAGSYTQSTIPTPGIFRIGGIAVDGSGNVYVGENDNNNTFMEILKEVPVMDGYAQSIIPAPGVTGIGEVAVDEDGNVYICDNVNNTVLKETLSAGNYTQSEISTSSLNDPQGVAVDGGGNVYIVDANNVRVLKEDFADPPSLSFASATVGSTSTDSPQTVTIENVGNANLSFPIPSTGNNPNIAANFTLNSSGASACPLLSAGSSTAGTLAAGASCLLPISFTPTAAGALSGSLVLTDNNLNAAAPSYTTQSIPLNGTGGSTTPAITWSTPGAITYGTPLSATQLNATETVAGTFTYSPGAGTVLAAGSQTLTATFTPTDTTDYTTATASVTLTVNKATPTITWATPKAIIFGTALSATQLDASSPVAGTFTYSPAAGTVLAVGAQTLKVTFAPKDSADYTTAAGSVTLTVNPAPSFTLAASPASMTVTQGASGKSTIAVTALNGFTGKVTLAASGLPSGVTASFATNPTTGTSVLTFAASNTAVTGVYKVTITGTSGSLTATTTIALTVNGFACHVGYMIESQWKGGFEAAVTIKNTGVKAISNWTLTWTFANGQKITSIWDGTETQSGANVTVTNMSFDGSIPAGGSFTGLGFNASWNNSTNAVPTSFAVNGTTCK